MSTDADTAAIAEADAKLAADRAALLEELTTVAKKLEQVPAFLRAQRLELYRRGRELGITFVVLGDAAGKSEPSVIQELKKLPK